MFSSKIKALVIVFSLLLITSLIAVGCRSKTETKVVNTNTLPGHAYSDYVSSKNENLSNSKIVYLGSSDPSSDVSFGPKDVSFEFEALK